jgi:hypothetical protein
LLLICPLLARAAAGTEEERLVVILHSDSPLQDKDAACELRFTAGGNQTAEWGVDRSWVIWGGLSDLAPVVVTIGHRQLSEAKPW